MRTFLCKIQIQTYFVWKIFLSYSLWRDIRKFTFLGDALNPLRCVPSIWSLASRSKFVVWDISAPSFSFVSLVWEVWLFFPVSCRINKVEILTTSRKYDTVNYDNTILPTFHLEKWGISPDRRSADKGESEFSGRFRVLRCPYD